MKGRYNSLRAIVVDRAALRGGKNVESKGSTEFGGSIHYKLLDFYGYDYIVTCTSDGFVDVTRFDHIDIDQDGYYSPVARAWTLLDAEQEVDLSSLDS